MSRPRPARTPNHRLLHAAALAVVIGGAVEPASAQSFVLYDNFSSGKIDPSLWSGEEGRQAGGIRLEASRSVASGVLSISARAYGDNVRSSGTSQARDSLVMTRSSSVTAMKATVTMRSTAFVNCAANPTPNAARARLFGFYFNAGTTVPGSSMNDVYAGVQVQRLSNTPDASGIYHVIGFIGICTDDNCVNSTTLNSTDLGTVAINVPVTMSLAWNASGNSFSFQRDSLSAVTLPYTASDSMPPGVPNKRIEISNNIAQCAGSRAGVRSSADFDNVMTNALPAQPSSLSWQPADGLEVERSETMN